MTIDLKFKVGTKCLYFTSMQICYPIYQPNSTATQCYTLHLKFKINVTLLQYRNTAVGAFQAIEVLQLNAMQWSIPFSSYNIHSINQANAKSKGTPFSAQ